MLCFVAQATAQSNFRADAPSSRTDFPCAGSPKECQIIEGHLMPDQVHMCIAIPPKHPVAWVIGSLKGKGAIAIARLCGKERNFSGEHF
jgi:REP element-mobilizing transposase RayT